MRAVTLLEPGRLELAERPDPEPVRRDDVVIRVHASGICGSDLHMFHGRVPVAAGFTLGHEYVGAVVAAGDDVTAVAVGDRVLGAFCTACGRCVDCARGRFQHCSERCLIGLGGGDRALPGAQADLVRVPFANLTLRPVPAGIPDRSALFAGDVLATAFHAVVAGGLRPGESCAVVGLGPVGLCAAMVAALGGATTVLGIDTIADRLDRARQLGAIPVSAAEEDVPARVREHTGGRGVDLVVEAVGSPKALATACAVAGAGGTVSVVGLFAEPAAVQMGLIFEKGLRVVAGMANVIGHLDQVLALMASGRLDPGPLVSHEMPLEDAVAAYEAFDKREALKIMLRP